MGHTWPPLRDTPLPSFVSLSQALPSPASPHSPLTPSSHTTLTHRIPTPPHPSPSPEVDLQLEGLHGVWEMVVNKEHHVDITPLQMQTLLDAVMHEDIQCAAVATAAIWTMAAAQKARVTLLEKQVLGKLVQAAERAIRAEDTGKMPAGSALGSMRAVNRPHHNLSRPATAEGAERPNTGEFGWRVTTFAWLLALTLCNALALRTPSASHPLCHVASAPSTHSHPTTPTTPAISTTPNPCTPSAPPPYRPHPHGAPPSGRRGAFQPRC